MEFFYIRFAREEGVTMRYIMRAGALYREPNQVVAKLKGVLIGSEKTVHGPDGVLALKMQIRRTDAAGEQKTDVRSLAYVMVDSLDHEIAIARPDYAEGDDPAVVGWPVCRMPHVDHAKIDMNGEEYMLVMHNSQNYALMDVSGRTIVQIVHRGLSGGWNIDTDESFTPEILCGFFVFCRYLEQENELILV